MSDFNALKAQYDIVTSLERAHLVMLNMARTIEQRVAELEPQRDAVMLIERLTREQLKGAREYLQQLQAQEGA